MVKNSWESIGVIVDAPFGKFASDNLLPLHRFIKEKGL